MNVFIACTTDETKISSPFIYAYGTNDTQFCATLRTRPDNFYDVKFRTECQRWIGLESLPDRVGASTPIYCYQWQVNNTAYYQMDICCPGKS